MRRRNLIAIATATLLVLPPATASAAGAQWSTRRALPPLDGVEKNVVYATFYTGVLNWYWQAQDSPVLSMGGYAQTARGGTLTGVTACLYNESSTLRYFRATASVAQFGATVQAVTFERNFPPNGVTCHTVTDLDALLEPGEFVVVVSYDRFEAENLFAGLASTDGGQIFDVQVGSERPPYADGPYGSIQMHGVGIQYRIEEEDPSPPPPPPPPPPACAPDSQTLCLVDGRFRVQLEWQSSTASGTGHALPIPGVGSSGLFWFFNPNNLEALVKVIDACSLNHRRWVFFAATTNLGFELRVTDTVSGLTKTWSNELGNTAAPVQDTDAFPCAEVTE